MSFSDFVNRRLYHGPNERGKDSIENFATIDLEAWTTGEANSFSKMSRETLDTITGLRGAVQSAIASSGLNDGNDERWKTQK